MATTDRAERAAMEKWLLLPRSECRSAALRCPTWSAGRMSGRGLQPLAFFALVQRFLVMVCLERLPEWTASDWDAAMKDRGHSKVAPALIRAAPHLGERAKCVLPMAQASGWQRLQPPMTRPPLRRAVGWGIVEKMLAAGLKFQSPFMRGRRSRGLGRRSV